MEVNKVGADILNLFFNENKDIGEIIEKIRIDSSIPMSVIQNDVICFLENIEKEMVKGGYNLIEEQDQLNIPLGAELAITSSCNLRCRHCLQDDYENIFMPTDKAVDIIKLLAKTGVFEVNLVGGEPFTHSGLFRILESSEKESVAVNLITNGTLLDDKMIEQLGDFKHLVLCVSLDGVGKDHDYIRGEGTFEKVDYVLRKFSKMNFVIETLCTLNSYNLSKYREIIEYCNALGIPCNFNLFKPFKPEHHHLVPTPQQIFEVIIDLFEMRKIKKYKIGLSNAAITSELLGLPLHNECKATKTGLSIDTQGRMITCPSLVYSGFYKKRELPLFDEKFVETWKNHWTFKQFRNNGLLECQARAHIFSKDVRAVDPYGITAFRNYFIGNKL